MADWEKERINGKIAFLPRTFPSLSLTFLSPFTPLLYRDNDSISFFLRSTKSTYLSISYLIISTIATSSPLQQDVAVRKAWASEDSPLTMMISSQLLQIWVEATPDLRGSRSWWLVSDLRIFRLRQSWGDPTIRWKSASKVLLKLYNLNIYYLLLHFLTLPPTLDTQDRKIYIYIRNLMNVRQQSKTPNSIHRTHAMAYSTSSALDNILRHEANSVRFESDSTPSLSNALQLTLAGKLLSHKKPSISNMILYASRTWECPNRLMCYDHGSGIFSFEFINQADVEKVISGGPWYINGDLLLVTRMDPNLSIEQLPFSETKLWIRCYDLPPKCFNLKFARLIGNGIGRFCDTDLPPEDPSLAPISIRRVPTVRKYLRVKVSYSLALPLKRTQMVEIMNTRTRCIEEKYSRLAYERLPVMCFRCGYLGHSVDSCQLAGPILYGDWIRAEKFYRSKMPEKIPSPPKNLTISPAKQVLRGESSRPPAIVVSTTAELFSSNIIPSPDIIQASFQEIRDAGALPKSKGKALLIESLPYPDYIPCSESSNRFSPSQPVGAASILGPIPQNNAKPPRPFTNNIDSTIILDSEVGNLSSYFNPSIPHADLFSPNTNRCLFKSELVHQALSTEQKKEEFSPKQLSPIPKELALFENNITFTEMLSLPPPAVTCVEDNSKLSVVTRKRASAVKSVESNRTRKGRGTPTPDSQA